MLKKVIVIGLDGLDPGITESMLSAGELPNLARLRAAGGYRRLASTTPAQTPVAWSSFATGANPGSHGIFDFLQRDASSYRPEVALYRYERPNRFLPPRPVNLRGGTAVWDSLGEAGIESVVLRHPCAFPPPKPLRGRMLAGVGVPDVRGGFGTGTVYSSGREPASVEADGARGGERGGERAGEGEVVVPIQPEDGRVRTHLPGPRGKDGPLEFEITARFDPAGGRVRIDSEGTPGSLEVREGEWSEWLRVAYRAGPLQKIRGRVRFHLASAREPYLLYAGPVNFDPEVPQHPISEPWGYAWELDRALDGFHTLGMAEDHSGLNNGRLSEAAYLAQCADVRAERLAMMRYELERHDRGFFFCLFDTPDRVQHMFWRYREPDHPANRTHPPDPRFDRAIEDEYRACDDAVGQALVYADDETLFLVASDHGFTSFQRQLHLNRWLQEQGFLVLRDGGVDWGRTRAYAVGLVGIYLNLRGREQQGIVSAEEAPAVARAVQQGLSGLVDRDRGVEAVRAVLTRDSVYRGRYVENAPDLVVHCAPGYRVSSATALGAGAGMGGVPSAVFADNTKRWSGDHVVDPAAVPGVLFSNRPVAAERPRIIDLAPTILTALGVAVPDSYEGEGVLA